MLRRFPFALALLASPAFGQSSTPISALPAASTLTGSEIVPIVQSAATKRTTTAAVAGTITGLSNTWTAANVVARTGDVTTDPTVTTSTSNWQTWRTASATSSGSANEQTAFFSLNIPAGHGSGIAYEAEPLYTRCTTADSNTYGLGAYDCVGAEFQAITSGTGSLMRIWGTDTVVNVIPGSDGYATGYESGIYNNGTTGALQTATVKQNFNAACLGPNNCTAIMNANAVGGSAYNYGFPMIKQIFATGAPVFAIVDSGASFASIAGIYADGHTLALNNAEVIGAAATTRYTGFYTGANSSSLSLRWNGGANNTAESGSNAGSDYNICSYSDSGSFLTCPLTITRSTGNVTIGSLSATTLYNTTANLTNNITSGYTQTKFLAGNGAATFAVGAGAGTGATVVCLSGHICDNVGGTLTLTTGTSPAAGAQLTITFSVARTYLPNCVFNITSGTALYFANSTTSTAVANTAAALSASTGYTVGYVCTGV